MDVSETTQSTSSTSHTAWTLSAAVNCWIPPLILKRRLQHLVDRVWHMSVLYNVHLKIKPPCVCVCVRSCLNLEGHYKNASHLLSAKVQRGRLEADGSPGVPHVKRGTERKNTNINNTNLERKTYTL